MFGLMASLKGATRVEIRNPFFLLERDGGLGRELGHRVASEIA